MRITRLQVTDFRNIGRADVSPGPGMNLIVGSNGQGKTNLVEAITFLSWLKSFRTSRTTDLVAHGSESAHLLGSVTGGRGDHAIEVGVGRGFRRVTLDDHPVRSSRECLSRLTVAFLSPDDPAILEGGPDGRRTLVDRFAVLLDPSRTALMSRYAKLVRERNEILKALNGPWDPAVLDACEEAMAEAGGQVVRARLEALDSLLEHLPATLDDMAGEDLSVAVSYASRWLPEDTDRGDEGAHLRERLKERRTTDGTLARTTVGPHTDDLQVDLQGHRARGHASRGQRKVLMLAWKAAETRVYRGNLQADPVLVLDDALADLDARRQVRVVEYLAAYPGQSFLTGTSTPGDPLPDCRVFHTEAGRFTSKD